MYRLPQKISNQETCNKRRSPVAMPGLPGRQSGGEAMTVFMHNLTDNILKSYAGVNRKRRFGR